MRLRIVEIIDNHETNLEQDSGHIQFLCLVNDGQYEYIMSYNYIINHISDNYYQYFVWKLKLIVSDQGTLIAYRPNYKLSWFNVMFEWDTVEITTDLLSFIVSYDPQKFTLYYDYDKLWGNNDGDISS